MIKGGKSGTRCSFVSLTSGSVLRLPGGVAGEKADLSWPGSLYLTLCIPIQLLNTHLYENTGHMCSSKLTSAFLRSFLFCTHLNLTLNGIQEDFRLFVCSHLLHMVICIMQTWQWGRGCNSWFFFLLIYISNALTELVGGGWYLSLGDGGWYTWPGDWVQSSRQGQRFHPPRHCNMLNTSRTCVQHQLNILILKNMGKLQQSLLWF